MKRKKFIIGGIILGVALAFLIYMGLKGSPTYTVSEFLRPENRTQGQLVRVQGMVQAGTIEQKAADLSLKFIMVEGGGRLPIAYKGVVPDTFKAGGDIVVEGKLDPSGTFVATTLMPKCPSKYVPQ